MPKKKVQESQAEQSNRFRKTVRDLVAAGELNATEADHALEGLVRRARKPLESGDSAKNQ
jgi:polyhydroxyalkanoate synthesis regulator phasin